MKLTIHCSPWALLTAALFYFFMGAERLPALLIPVLVHELGHIAAMKALGMDVRRIDVEPGGLCISYRSERGRGGDILAAVCGPLAGIPYGIFAVRSGSARLQLSGSISLLLSAFNLIPAMPLDGGRILYSVLSNRTDDKTTQLAETISFSAAVLVFLSGTYLACRGAGLSVLAAGAWLMVCQFLVSSY